jgi:hypothetical protein
MLIAVFARWRTDMNAMLPDRPPWSELNISGPPKRASGLKSQDLLKPWPVMRQQGKLARRAVADGAGLRQGRSTLPLRLAYAPEGCGEEARSSI